MPHSVSTRKNANQFIYSIAPDVCLTPMGSSQVPVPYLSIGFFDDAVRTEDSVRYQGEPEVNLKTRISKTQGTEAGTGRGLKHKGHLGPALATKGSSSVFSKGEQSIRASDKAGINMDSL